MSSTGELRYVTDADARRRAEEILRSQPKARMTIDEYMKKNATELSQLKGEGDIE